MAAGPNPTCVKAGTFGTGSSSLSIVHMSDSHNKHRKYTSVIPKADLFVFTGDLGNFNNSANYWQWLLQDFNAWLGSLPCKQKIVIFGNHDNFCKGWTKEQIQEQLPNCIYLQDSMTEIKGCRIYGTPVNEVTHPSFNFGYDPTTRKRFWRAIPPCDVLLTHMPPFNLYDKAWSQASKGSYKCSDCGQTHTNNYHHWGDRDLRAEVTGRIRPTLHLFGHVHDESGARTEEGVTFINASVDQIHKIYSMTLKFTPRSGSASFSGPGSGSMSSAEDGREWAEVDGRRDLMTEPARMSGSASDSGADARSASGSGGESRSGSPPPRRRGGGSSSGAGSRSRGGAGSGSGSD